MNFNLYEVLNMGTLIFYKNNNMGIKNKLTNKHTLETPSQAAPTSTQNLQSPMPRETIIKSRFQCMSKYYLYYDYVDVCEARSCKNSLVSNQRLVNDNIRIFSVRCLTISDPQLIFNAPFQGYLHVYWFFYFLKIFQGLFRISKTER